MNAEAHAWSDTSFEPEDGTVPDAGAGIVPAGSPPAPGPRRPARQAGRRPQRFVGGASGINPEPTRPEPTRPEPTRPASRTDVVSWNVLAEQLVSFPTPAKRIFLEQTSPGRERSRDGRGDRPDADGARSYGEAWLERELLAIRYRADAGYPALETRPSSASRAVAGEQLDPELAPAGDVYRSDPERRGRVARELAAQTRAGAAAEPRGLRRLLPGVATLAALAGLWAGAGMLAAGQRPALAVLPGSVKTQAGYVYVVRPGDTLWSIATRLRPGGDPRVIVAQLESQVGGGTLVPGSRLVLP